MNINAVIPYVGQEIPRINPEKTLKINKISMEAHSNCNARCSYCSEMFYGGLNPNYNLNDMLTKFRKQNFFSENVS